MRSARRVTRSRSSRRFSRDRFRMCASAVLMSCMLKFLHVSGRPVRKSGKNEKGTRRNHGGVFRVPGRLENIREVYDSPRARGSSRAKNSSFFGNFRRFWVGIRNTEKVLFVHAKKATASSDSSSRGRLLRPLLRALDRYRDIARAFRTGTSPPESVSPSRARSDGRPSTADPPPRRG